MTHPGDEITPRTDDARSEALLDQVSKTLIGGIEVFGSDARVVRLPWVTGFVGAARVERRHVRVKAGNDLNDIKAFFFPVSPSKLTAASSWKKKTPHISCEIRLEH